MGIRVRKNGDEKQFTLRGDSFQVNSSRDDSFSSINCDYLSFHQRVSSNKKVINQYFHLESYNQPKVF